MNRPDKVWNKLSITERDIGGIPNSSEDIKQAHASAIETYINTSVGSTKDGFGDMYFQRTLEDWARFNINNRTKHDASISSGLAIMACNRHLYKPNATVDNPPISSIIDWSKFLGLILTPFMGLKFSTGTFK